MIKSYFISLACCLSLHAYTQAFLQVPIQGIQGEDWTIVNYVDWDTIGFKDHQCGFKSYDGHQGTDFTIRSFKAMDDSVAVYAAASGMVTYTIDGLFDRETESDISKGLGNYIAISHPNKFYTYYGHLKTNSIQVVIGDSVKAGELIGYIGSSGNSTDPHLHFELWYDSLYVVDPFAGLCGNVSSRFINPPVYDTTLTIWESGMHLKNDLDINDLRERITTLDKPYVIAPTSDSLLYFWSHLYGLKKGKSISVEWYTPDNEEWFEYSIILDKDYWYYYYWSFINHENLTTGDWTVKFIYDGNEIAKETFEVKSLSSNTKQIELSNCEEFKKWSNEELLTNSNIALDVYNINGQQLLTKNTDFIPTGIYILGIQKGKAYCTLRRWMD